jgi:hypothetical protein
VEICHRRRRYRGSCDERCLKMDAQPVSAIRRSSVELPVEGLDGMFDQGSHSLIRNGRRRSPDCAWRAANQNLYLRQGWLGCTNDHRPLSIVWRRRPFVFASGRRRSTK